MSSKKNAGPLSHPIYEPLPSAPPLSGKKEGSSKMLLHNRLSTILHGSSSEGIRRQYANDLEHKLGFRSIRLEREYKKKKFAYDRGDRGGVKRTSKRTSKQGVKHTHTRTVKKKAKEPLKEPLKELTQSSTKTKKDDAELVDGKSAKKLRKSYKNYLKSLKLGPSTPPDRSVLVVPGATIETEEKRRQFIVTSVVGDVWEGVPVSGGRVRRVQGLLVYNEKRIRFLR